MQRSGKHQDVNIVSYFIFFLNFMVSCLPLYLFPTVSAIALGGPGKTVSDRKAGDEGAEVKSGVQRCIASLTRDSCSLVPFASILEMGV